MSDLEFQISPGLLERYVRSLTLGGILDLLVDPGFVLECIDSGDTHPCPHCQRDGAALLDRAPAAYVLDAVRWICGWCKAEGTRFQVERALLEDPAALDRLLVYFDTYGDAA